jgi:hypothetical protein
MTAAALNRDGLVTVATKDDLRHEAAALRKETQTLGAGLRTEMAGLSTELMVAVQTFRSQVIAAVASMLLIHLGAVWGIVGAHLP